MLSLWIVIPEDSTSERNRVGVESKTATSTSIPAVFNKGKRFVVSLSAPPILNDVMTYNIRIMSVAVLKVLIENF